MRPFCEHDSYELLAGDYSIGFCRVTGCHGWRIAGRFGTADGYGLASYQDAIAIIAEEDAPADAAFLYDLGGHAPEVANA
jgi:hypothetical protein